MCFDTKPRGALNGHPELGVYANHPAPFSGQGSAKTAAIFSSDSFTLPVGRFGPAKISGTPLRTVPRMRRPLLPATDSFAIRQLANRQLKRSQSRESPPPSASRGCEAADRHHEDPTPRQVSGAVLDIDADFQSKMAGPGGFEMSSPSGLLDPSLNRSSGVALRMLERNPPKEEGCGNLDASLQTIGNSVVTLPSPEREMASEFLTKISPAPCGARTESKVDSMQTSDNAGDSGPKPFRWPVFGRLIRFRYFQQQVPGRR